MISREDKLKMFINEIGDIKDANLKAFATELIANADDYFFVVPASSSGKYHPPFDLGDGGLVRHTRLVAYMARSLAESYCFSDYDTDCLIVAALAHDIKKQGNGDTGHTVWDHPILAMHYVQEIYGKTNFNVPADTIEKISNAVSSHMGKWGNEPRFCKGNTPLPMPVTEFDKALQAADYVASRKEIIDFKFRDTEEVNIVAQPKSVLPSVNEMSLFELENYQMPFGKHKGKTLREVKPTGYLDWMLKQTDFANKDTQEIVRAYFNKLRESVTSDGREKVKEENKAYVAENASQSLPIDEDDLPF
jgi:uncharacterized protein (DUF3820 family)